MESDLLASVDGPFDLVVSNPPYVRADELDALEPEVRDWEPRGALVDQGQTERLAAEARARLDGSLVLEVHADHAGEIVERAHRARLRGATIRLDLAGRERVVEAHGGTAADALIDELRAGRPVLLPTDTVYGLCSTPGEAEVERLYALKGRRPSNRRRCSRRRSSSCSAASPKLGDQQLIARDAAARAVHARPAQSGAALRLAGRPGPEALGVRCRAAAGDAARARGRRLRRRHERQRPWRRRSAALDDVPRGSGACARSTPGRCPEPRRRVIDFTGAEPRVLREGAGPRALEAIARVRRLTQVRSG